MSAGSSSVGCRCCCSVLQGLATGPGSLSSQAGRGPAVADQRLSSRPIPPAQSRHQTSGRSPGALQHRSSPDPLLQGEGKAHHPAAIAPPAAPASRARRLHHRVNAALRWRSCSPVGVGVLTLSWPRCWRRHGADAGPHHGPVHFDFAGTAAATQAAGGDVHARLLRRLQPVFPLQQTLRRPFGQ